MASAERQRWRTIFWPSLLNHVLVLVLVSREGGRAEVLTPPYFNLAENRRITATATCGEDEPELYCKLVGANADTADINVHSHILIQGQVCDYCDRNKEGKAHPAQYAIDGSERWWQSPPLSRGMKYNEVNLTIDLGQEFHVAYVFITMANSPRPGVWVLERSSDNGKTYKPWQYFADTPGDCDRLFGVNSMEGITKDDSVVCDTTFSKVVPLEGGEIVVSLLNNRPSASDFFSSSVLQEWTRATTIRLRLLRTKTLLGHLMSVARQDHTVTRRYFYSIKDISIGGRCRCNGHADLCDITDPEDAYKLLCRCQHNTCGAQCEQCCPGHVQKAWRPATYTAPFFCEQCNCFGHSQDCYYDEQVDRNRSSLDVEGRYEGGGVCVNCRDNTEGINCHKCKPRYFRPYATPLNATDVCKPCDCDNFFSTGNCEEGSGRCECRVEFQAPNCDSCNTGYYDYPECKPCDCHVNGTRGEMCEVGGGQCPCKQNFSGQNCDSCAEGYYNFPQCLPCACDTVASVSEICDPIDGQCECNNQFGGRTCSSCEAGYFKFPSCVYCSCDIQGTQEGICDKEDGRCLCREGYGGSRCDQCLPSFYGYPDCRLCNCSAVGSATTVCDATGKCPCSPNFSGRACDQCSPGYYKYPDCLSCECKSVGSMGVTCDDEGKCQCNANFDGLRCTECREGFYNFPQCEECNCDPAGVIESFSGCGDSPPGELCQCKPRVQGRICQDCKPLFWNLQQYNPQGCQECHCHIPGILGNVQVCEGKSGQCPCKPNVGSRQCDTCQDGNYNLQADNLLGCTDCGCDVGGAASNICEKQRGQCACRPRITGKTCKIPLQTHYFPTLYQFQYEAEDGLTTSGGPVRFGYDQGLFRDYSWRGYAVYSQLQPQTIHEVFVEKSSLYRVVVHYINSGDQTVVGEIVASPDNPKDDEFKYKMRFEPTSAPTGNFLTVSQMGNTPAPFVLNPGRWHIGLKSQQYLLIDYFVLLPEAYYEGSILQNRVSTPCLLNTTNTRGRKNIIRPDPCVLFSYPSLGKFDSVSGTESFVEEGGERAEPRFFYSDSRVLETLKSASDRLVYINPQQTRLETDLSVRKGGRYALVVEYLTPHGTNMTTLDIEATSKKGTTRGQALIYNCVYATFCRQVMTTQDGEVAVFKFDQNLINIKLQAPEDLEDRIAISSITAIPLGKWSLDYIRPKQYCIVNNGTCLSVSYELPPDSTKVEAEASNTDRVVDDSNLPEGLSNKSLVLLDANDRDRTLEISGKVSNPGYYTFLVHYHQPESPDFVVEAVVKNGQHHEAGIRAEHCPSVTGCRSVVVEEDNNSRFYLDEDFQVTLTSPKKLLVDYMVVVPAPYDNQRELSKYLEPLPIDETSRFIAECGKNHMYLAKNTSDFCRNSVFSLTTEYNNGALRCQCDVDGSLSFECEQFGGQCPCKNDVIGRRCERCRTGFFGFPNCRPCDCPSTALCDPENGECICPSRVTGPRCDMCEPFTYGFDALIGCEDCACSRPGVEDGNLQCDLNTGLCPCKQNVVGRTCDRCVPGYWAFPLCQLCGCDLRGTTDDICSQETAECFCKANVEGRGCESCKVGSFNLQERNAAGCTKCFCFGKTSRCSSSSLFWTQVSGSMRQLTSVLFDPTRNVLVTEKGFEIEFEGVESDEANEFIPAYIPEETIPPANESRVMYFRVALPSNHLASYGGKLNYILTSEPDDSQERQSFVGPDVILEGRELPPSSNVLRLMHYTVEHLDGDNSIKMSLELIDENLMVLSPTGGLVPATREQTMIVLKELQAIYIRAAYWRRTREVKLSSFSLDVGSEQYSPADERALTVERCQCPPNYQGLSCEECAPGYYRSPTGPFGGFCVPCQCNRHSETCDPVSGKCLNCQHNTMGDHCEMCDVGYHGNATGGTPHDCLICACPLPIASNNFATSCELLTDGADIECECRPGYGGRRCEYCGPGFFGDPELQGDYCRPCECSGNIDEENPQACDSVTGRCLLCLNNTGGPACALCAPGYYGDAIESKDCRNCACSVCGTDECDHRTGDCRCLNNVIGLNCDRCRPDHYGLSLCDGSGCHFCDCDVAAESTQCDDRTGQCQCRNGTTGRRCERCSPGYWNYSPEGCQACECNQDYAVGVGCDPETGQCSCLPGVIGDKCDRCPHRWVLIENQGCQPCESCHHQLLDSTDQLAAIFDPVKADFDSVAVSYFTTQKLAYLNETASRLEPEVRLLDPSRVEIQPYYSSLDALEQDSKSAKQKADVSKDSLRDKARLSSKLRDKSFQVESKVQEAVAKARTAVFETKDLMEGLLVEEKFSSPQMEAAMTEVQAIIDSMNNVEFNKDDALQEEKNANKVLKEIREYIAPVKLITTDIGKNSRHMLKLKDKLKDIRNQSDYSVETANRANAISSQIRDAKFPAKLAVLESRSSEMEENLAKAMDLNEDTEPVLQALEGDLDDLGSIKNTVQNLHDTLEDNVEILSGELDKNRDTIHLSKEHVRKLREEADELDAMLGDTRLASNNAVSAATAYQKIIDALQDANDAAVEARQNANNASQITTEVSKLASVAIEPSSNMLKTAKQSSQLVDHELEIPLKDYKGSMQRVRESNANITSALQGIERGLDRLTPRDGADMEATIDISSEGTEKAQEALESVEATVRTLPLHVNQSRQLPITVQDLNEGVQISDSQLNQAKDSIPLSEAITGSLESKKPMLDESKTEIAGKLNDLRAKISTAREQANRVPVGIHFDQSSSLMLANPVSLESQQSQTKLSLYFKTPEPEGLILYLGNEAGRKGEDDFLAIEVDGGYPVLTVDLGSGPQRISNKKFVADDKWYKAVVSRVGKNVQFTIVEEDQLERTKEFPSESFISGPKSLLNVDGNSSKLFVGGLPAPGEVKKPVKHNSYRGVIEDLTIGDQKVGLWNFKEANNLGPAQGRDRFVDLRPRTGLRFQGNGFAILDRSQYQFSEKAAVRLNFQTRAEAGLLFLVGKGRKYLSLEIVDGSVLFQFDLGGGPASIRTVETFNDGQWHQVDAVRFRNQAALNVDSQLKGRNNSLGSQTHLAVSNYMYVGGYPGQHDYPTVTQKDFEGCIDNVTIDEKPVDLTQAVETRYTLVGCPSPQFDQLVTTFGGDGFVQLVAGPSTAQGPSISLNEETFELNLRMRSNDTHGLIFYGSSEDQSTFLSVSLAEGSLYVKTEPGGAQVKTDPLNDGNWHVITVTRDRNKLLVNVDDISEYMESASNGPLYLAGPGTQLLFGGRPDDYPMRSGAAVADTGFNGCLADMNINGKRIDLTDATIQDSTLGQTCFIGVVKDADDVLLSRKSPTIPPEEVDGEVEVMPPRPTQPVPTTTTPTPRKRVEDVEEMSTTPEPRRPKPTKVTPTPFMECALPYPEVPEDNHPVSIEEGVRFGSFEKTSRLEFMIHDEDKSRSEYSVEFRTGAPDGLVFFRSDFIKSDFVALFMRKGILHFSFDSGSGPAVLNSTRALNDTKWHTATFTRSQSMGELSVDGELMASGKSPGSTTDINAGPTLFLGGLPPSAWTKQLTAKKILGIDSAFRGCLKNFLIKGKSPGQPTLQNSVEPCSEEVESGYFFYPNSGYLRLGTKFQVGMNIKISLSIKPRHPSGLIMSVHGNKDHIVLQMINGTVKFTVNNGHGPFSSSFSKGHYDLCDGKWHTILATKTKNVATLAIDGQHAQVGLGALKSASTDTNHPLFLGGQPDPSAPGVETTDQFVGCMKDFVIQSRRPFRFTYDSIIGKVGSHACPLN